MVITGQISANGYITRFPVGSIDYNTDFTTSTALSMTALSSGTDDIVTDSGQTLGSAGAQSVTAVSYTNQTVTYSQVSSTCYSTHAAINIDSNLISTADGEKNTYISLLVVSVSVVVVLNVFSFTSTAALWSMINQVQLLFLLLLTQGFIPDAVQTVISGPDFAVNPFESISFLKTKNYGTWTDKFNFDLNNSSLGFFNIESISTFYNMISFFTTLAYAACVHLFFYLLRKIVSKWTSDGKWAKLLKRIINKAIEIMTLGYYIRLLMEMNEYIVLSAINEVYVFNTGQSLQVISAVFALLVMIGSVILIVLLLALSLSSYEIIEEEHNKLEELFEGMKIKKKFRIFSWIIMIRRFFFILFLVTLESIPSRGLIGLLVPLEISYIVYLVIFRPYQEIKVNAIEIVNEVSFLILLSALLVYNTSSDWTLAFAYIYIQVIVITNIINFLIIFGK